MKYLFFTLSFYAVSIGSFAQRKQSANMDKYLSKMSNLNLVPPRFSQKFPLSENHFAKFTVIDYRPDESRAGIGLTSLQEMQVTFHDVPVKTVVSDFFNKNYSTATSSSELVIVLKKLWYSSIDAGGLYQESDTEAETFNKNARSRLQFVAESYLKTADGFVPFASFDTTDFSRYDLSINGSSMLAEVLNAFVQKLNTKNIEHVIATRKPLDKIAVDSVSKRSFQSKIYSNDSLKKGIYKTAKDFFNNEPFSTEYEVQKDKAGLSSLYLKNEKGQLNYERNIWGLCDGHNFFVMMDGNLFPLYQNGYAFYVFGSKHYRQNKEMSGARVMNPAMSLPGSASPMAMAGAALVGDLFGKTRREVRLFILDNTTGEVL